MDDYEKYVGCAMSFYRNRWVHVPKFKKSGKRAVMVSRHRDNCRMARAYIQKARMAKNGRYAVCPKCKGRGRDKAIGWIVYACPTCSGCGIVLASTEGK